MDKFQAFGKNISYVPDLFVLRNPVLELTRSSAACNSATFSPFAQRTQQYVKEQLGQVEDKVRWT
jgi:hypothetical protein